jgi:hypothetical protein
MEISGSKVEKMLCVEIKRIEQAAVGASNEEPKKGSESMMKISLRCSVS